MTKGNDKLPPQDLKAEQATLGSILVEPGAAERAFAIVEEEDFYREAHQIVFRAMRACYDRGDPLDLVTVSAELRRIEQLDNVGGGEYLTALIGKVPTAAHVVRYAEIVAQKAILRKAAAFGEELTNSAYQDPADIDAFLDEHRARYEKLYERRGVERPLDFTPLSTVAENIEGIGWLWPGWLPVGFVTLLAGEGEIGKSALVQFLLQSIGQGQDWPDGSPPTATDGPALYLDYDNSQALLAYRRENWGLQAVDPLLPGDDGLAQYKLDNPGILASLRQSITKHHSAVLIIDPLTGSHSLNENSAEMDRLLNGLAALARDLRIAVLICHHLRKKGELEGSEVTMDRVRGHGSIGTNARVVWGMHKPSADSELRLLYQVKNNIAAKPDRLAVQIDNDGIVFVQPPEERQRRGKVDQAVDFLRELLEKGAVPCQEIRKLAYTQGVHSRDLYAAKKRLNVIDPKNPEGLRQKHWGLPEKRLL